MVKKTSQTYGGLLLAFKANARTSNYLRAGSSGYKFIEFAKRYRCTQYLTITNEQKAFAAKSNLKMRTTTQSKFEKQQTKHVTFRLVCDPHLTHPILRVREVSEKTSSETWLMNERRIFWAGNMASDVK